MTRMIRGSVLLAACVGLWSCSSDPLGDGAGVPSKIVSLPSIVFVNEGSSQLIAFQLVDDQDGQIPTDWTIGATPLEFSVAVDSSFRPIYNPDGTLTLPAEQTELRATISGLVAGATEFTVSAQGKSLVIPVYVVPVAFQATVGPTTTAVFGDTLTVTMPAGYIIRPDAVITTGGANQAYVVSVAADGSSAQFVPSPESGAATVRVAGVEISFLPGTSLTLPTLVTVTRPAQDDVPAPPLAIPAVGSTTIFTDPFGSGADQFYQFTVNGTQTIKVTVDWPGAADIDILWCDAACGAFVGNFDGAGSSHPETSTVTLAAGTYNLWVNVYDDHGEPPVSITVSWENVAP